MRFTEKITGLPLGVLLILGGTALPAHASTQSAATECQSKKFVSSQILAELTSCTEGEKVRVHGEIESNADDGKCTRLVIRIAAYAGGWSVCDDQSSSVDTGFQRGTQATYNFVTY